MTRTGVVLGAGGVLGAAWTIGALAALQEQRGWDPCEADVLVGTSAGSVLASFLGCGIGFVAMIVLERRTPRIGRFEEDPEHVSDGSLV